MTDILERFYEGEEAKSLLQEQADEIERLRQRVKELEDILTIRANRIIELELNLAELRKAHGEPVAWGNFKEDGTCVGLSQHPEDIARWQNPKPLYTSAPSIPEGCQIVPVEPTPKMAIACAHKRWGKPLSNPDSSRDIWKAMLAAAPKYNT